MISLGGGGVINETITVAIPAMIVGKAPSHKYHGLCGHVGHTTNCNNSCDIDPTNNPAINPYLLTLLQNNARITVIASIE
jgi:hypothetical protein